MDLAGRSEKKRCKTGEVPKVGSYIEEDCIRLQIQENELCQSSFDESVSQYLSGCNIVDNREIFSPEQGTGDLLRTIERLVRIALSNW